MIAGPAPWVLAAIALGGLVGGGVALGGSATGAAVALLPVGIALAARPQWLPVVLMVTVFTEAFTIGGVSISRAAGPLALLLVLLQVRHDSPLRLRGLDRPLLAAIGGYVIWAGASLMWTVNVDQSFAPGSTAFELSALILSGVYLLTIVSFTTTARDLLVLLVTIWALSALVGVYAIVEQLIGGGRATGAAGDANFLASLQIIAIPLGAVLSSFVRTAAERAIVLFGIAISVGSVFVTLSRGGLIALAVLIVLLFFQPARDYFRTRARKRLFLGTVLVGGAILLAVSFSALSERTSSLFDSQEGGSGRTYLWEAARTGYEQHPVLGLGFGAFQSQSNRLLLTSPGVDLSAYKLRPEGQPVHNTYLQALTELGPLGLLLLLAMLGLTLRALRRSAKLAAANGAYFVAGVSRALTLSVVGFALTALFLSTDVHRTLWVLMAFALTLPRIAAATTAPGRRPS